MIKQLNENCNQSRSFSKEKVRLFIGLGNPGQEYQDTYHNAGFLFLNYLSGFNSSWKKEKNFIYTKFQKNYLVKPLVFINDSGEAVSAAARKFNCRPEGILVIHDDSDIEIGRYKLVFGRNSAGHQGVESVIKSLKTKNFWRMRIGVRTFQSKKRRKKAGEFVLQKIGQEAKAKINIVFREISSQVLEATKVAPGKLE